MLETIDSQGGHYTKDMFITVKKNNENTFTLITKCLSV